MQADRALPDAGALPGGVVAAAVEHHLVGVHIGVVVRHRDRERVVVDLARHEVADHEPVAREHLVHRRWLVHPPRDRLEVRHVERVRVEAPVPAHHVEGVCRVDVPGAGDPPAPPVLHQHLHVLRRFRAIHEERLGRAVQVALAVGRVLQELPEPGEVALGRRDVGVRLDCVEPKRFGPDRHPAVGGGPGQQHVVALPGGERSEDGLDDRTAGLDVHALVADRVAVERARLPRDDVGDAHVGVAEHEPPPGHGVQRPSSPRRGTGRAA